MECQPQGRRWETIPCKARKRARRYEEGKVPAGGEGLADNLAQHVVSPPLALRRILSYDRPRVRSWYNDHKTQQRQAEEGSALTFSGRIVPHIRPEGFHRRRYDGLPATGKAKEVKAGAHRADGSARAVDQGDLSSHGAANLP